ncbi:MAG: M23 family metallopeptidase [Acidobacteriota bacterium]
MDAVRLFLLTILFPLVAIALLWARSRRPLGGWVATLILALGVAGFSILAAPWGWFGMPLRYTLAATLVLAIVFSLRRPLPDVPKPDSPVRGMVKILVGLFFGGVAVGALSGRQVPPQPIELAFPLQHGIFLVAHGGSTGPSNMYNPDPVQRYAVDLVALNRAGMRASGLYPPDLKRYEIFDKDVLSPCRGTVLSFVDGLPDHVPGTLDAKHLAGNHVVIRCRDAAVTLAHLQQGSLRVHVGSTVSMGQIVGRAGNSGQSSEPHLHVHAERAGKAVPIRFDGQWLVRNDVVRRR